MKKYLSLLLIAATLFNAQSGLANGKLQNADFKSSAEIISAGGTIAGLLNDSKIYVSANGLNETLSTAITNGDLGGGGTNYIKNTNGTGGTTGYTAFKDAAGTTPVDGTGGSPTHISVSTTGTNPLFGAASLTISNSGSSSAQGEGVSYDFTIDKGLQASVLTTSFSYQQISGTFQPGIDPNGQLSDLEVYLYDVTNAQVIQPAGYKLYCASTTIPCVYTGTFQTASNSTSYRLIFFVPTTNTSAWSLKLGNVSVGPGSKQSITPVTDWQDYSLTIGATTSPPALGTTTVNHARWRRVGDSMEIGYDLVVTSAGSAGSGTYKWPIPSGYTIDTSKQRVSTTLMEASVGSVSIEVFGNQKVGQVQVYDANNLAIGYQDSTTNAFNFLASGLNGFGNSTTFRYSFHALVPIVGWSSSVGMASTARTTPTQTILTAGSGTYTTPNDVKYLHVRMTGAGGGGSGSGDSSSGGSGGSPSASTFGSLLTCNGGAGGTGGGNGGAGGTASISSPAYGKAPTGSDGAHGTGTAGTTSVYLAGGAGGAGLFLGAGSTGTIGGASGTAAKSNSGSGGGGGSQNISAGAGRSGGGGGAGGNVDAYIPNPSGSYSYSCASGGSGGSAGTAGAAGGAGGDCSIEITEYYRSEGALAKDELVSSKYQGSGTTSLPADGTNTQINFGTLVFDSHGAVTNPSSNFIFTAPNPGVYVIHAHVLTGSGQGWTAGDNGTLKIQKNASNTTIASSAFTVMNSPSTNLQQMLDIFGTEKMVSGDTIKIIGSIVRAGGATTVGVSAAENWVEIYRVGN